MLTLIVVGIVRDGLNRSNIENKDVINNLDVLMCSAIACIIIILLHICTCQVMFLLLLTVPM